MVLTLYKLDPSPPARAVMMVVEALGIPDVELIDVNFLQGEQLKEEYTKMNPQHTIPMLKDDDFYIWDSHAIAVYLVSKYGSDDSLYPADIKQRAIIDQRLHFDSGILFPCVRGSVELVFFGGEKTLRPENLTKIRKAYEFAEAFLTNTWLAGDQLTLADICCYSTLSSLNEMLPVDASLFPKLTAWLDRCSQQEFAKKANEPGILKFRELQKSKLG